MCANLSKKGVACRRGQAISCLAVRDKKNYGKMGFWFWVPTDLIEGELRAKNQVFSGSFGSF